MKSLDLNNKTILISRTDSIGDVILTLPICVSIKKKFPTSKIVFLGKEYTSPILKRLTAIDKILCWDIIEKLNFSEQCNVFKQENIDTIVHVFPRKEIAKISKSIKIPNRIGTSHRLFHLLTCNLRPNFTRKNSELHEAQLNYKLLENLQIDPPTFDELKTLLRDHFSINNIEDTSKYPFLKNGKQNIILHPKSQGSAREWAIENFISLANLLVEQNFNVLFSGTEKEGQLFRNFLPNHSQIFDITGKYTLDEFIDIIANSTALVACSTGPLHIAGLSNIKAIGLFNETKPIHPERWKQLGENSIVISDKRKLDLKSKEKEYLQIFVDDVFKAIKRQ